MTPRHSQKQSVLARLKMGPATTLELIRSLNICCVTKRISELRKDGFDIRTSEQWGIAGKRIVTYTLHTSGEAAAPSSCVPVRSHAHVCEQCWKEFESPHGRSRFCSTTCRTRHWKHAKRQAELFTGAQQISTAFADARE